MQAINVKQVQMSERNMDDVESPANGRLGDHLLVEVVAHPRMALWREEPELRPWNQLLQLDQGGQMKAGELQSFHDAHPVDLTCDALDEGSRRQSLHLELEFDSLESEHIAEQWHTLGLEALLEPGTRIQ